MNVQPGQIVDDLVYFNSDNSANLETYYAPSLSPDTNPQPSLRTKS